MNKVIYSMIAAVAIGCAPPQQETVYLDSTVVAIDSTTLEASVEPTVPVEVGEEYVMDNGYSYISDPFDFSLDSATVQELLGADATITSIDTPAGEDEMGAYDGYSFYEVASPQAKMSFYSYSGKHFADVYTSKLPFKLGIVVGMGKADFLAKMDLPPEAFKSTTFTFNDDYGSMSFYFIDDVLNNIYVSYEEGD